MNAAPETSQITKSDYAQLVAFWWNGSLPRPIRRRMVAVGMIEVDATGPRFSFGGTMFMLEQAPRSTWPRPVLDLEKGDTVQVHHPKAQHPYAKSPIALAAIVAAISADLSGHYRPGR